ncbi:MAG: hypothetical protein ACTSXQ_06160 [Alphaproteobacteria bacterium]
MEVSIREFARRKEVSPTAVMKAIKNGRIALNENKKIETDTADSDWENNKRVEKERDLSALTPNASENSRNIYQQSKTVKATYEAKLEKLKYEKEIGKLVSADQVHLDAFNTGRVTRERVLNIPDRVIPMLIGKTDLKEMKEILRTELTKALEELTRDYGNAE